MSGYKSMARGIGILVLAAGSVSPLVLTPSVAASLDAAAPAAASPAAAAVDRPWTHALAWGSNREGQVGNGTISNAFAIPVHVAGVVAGFQQVDAGRDHSLAVAADGTVYAWGLNRDGQVGVDRVPYQQDTGPGGRAERGHEGRCRRSAQSCATGRRHGVGVGRKPRGPTRRRHLG